MVCLFRTCHWAFRTVLYLRNFCYSVLRTDILLPTSEFRDTIEYIRNYSPCWQQREGMVLSQEGQEAVWDSGWINQMQILRNNLLTLSVSSNRTTSRQILLKTEGTGGGQLHQIIYKVSSSGFCFWMREKRYRKGMGGGQEGEKLKWISQKMF